MDFDFRCNRLSCRKSLTDKAVVVSGLPSQMECATELFNASRLCPACETSLTEPCAFSICLVSSLHPSNDYKTSVLSGLNPATVLEICSRAISFWQYQIHQEKCHAVVRSINDKNAQLQKQFDNVVREGEVYTLLDTCEAADRFSTAADGEINLLSSKLSGDSRTSSTASKYN
ncbi:hypothetical protein BC834DRAFT_825465 [Gloeopeniophorella convolvens]|nr:hypothetical protein BC834DRAFT_825465 [Gloeopeniophorella convolvens]